MMRAELPEGRILCAVSGGADSMCLLHMLWSSGADIAAAHYEHGIRGEEAMRDARFVEDWCRERGIECTVGHGNVPEYAAEHSMGTEEAARQLRYEFLRKTAEETGCRYIATAHNADDNAETLIFNLTRGTGTAGLRGIPPERENVIRPLLGFTRAEIEEYNEKNGISHVEDSTNASDDYSRNLIRHRVMPVLRQINPGFAAACGRTSELLRQDEDYLTETARAFLRDNSDSSGVSGERLREVHPAVASRVIRMMSGRSLSMEHVNAVMAICRGTEKLTADVPGGRFVYQQGRLFMAPEAQVGEDIALTAGQKIAIPQLGMEVSAEETVFRGEIHDLFKTLYLRCENITTVTLTGRRPGDRMRPAGRHCTKSLKSLFMEKGWTDIRRDTAVVIRDGDKILAVRGLAVDEKAIPLPGDRVIRINFESVQEKRNQNAQGC